MNGGPKTTNKAPENNTSPGQTFCLSHTHMFHIHMDLKRVHSCKIKDLNFSLAAFWRFVRLPGPIVLVTPQKAKQASHFDHLCQVFGNLIYSVTRILDIMCTISAFWHACFQLSLKRMSGLELGILDSNDLG